MTKQDLKPGVHFVQCRDADVMFVVENRYGDLMLMNENGDTAYLSAYKDDLVYKDTRRFDILKVGILSAGGDSFFNSVEWIWERQERTTETEYHILLALRENSTHIGRDEADDVVAYDEFSDSTHKLVLFKHYFKDIQIGHLTRISKLIRNYENEKD